MAPNATSVGSQEPNPSLGPSDSVLHKVRSLLAKAESSTFEDEAAAFTAKAQDLMARYAIDQAMIADGARGARIRPGERTIYLEAPYAKEKFFILNAVARANDVGALYSSGESSGLLVGFDDDLRTVEMLFTSLLVQATSGMLANGTSEATRRRRYRQSFLIAYSTRVAQRLAEAREATVREADAERGGAVLPVLASRAAEVEEALQERFPGVKSMKVVPRDARGWRHGVAAGDRADLGDRGAVSTRRRRSLRS